MTDMNISLRQTMLTVLAALLIVTAGCTTGIGGDSVGSDAAEENTETETEAERGIHPEDGDDLRTISFDKEFGDTAAEGELDGGDSQQNNRVYEPVEFAGQEGRYYNITLAGYGLDGEMRLVNPDGEVEAVATEDSSSHAQFELVKLNQTGKYTIEVTSVEEHETFAYRLYINEVQGAGPVDEWGKYERFGQFGGFTEHYWGEQAPAEAEFAYNNATEDYIVMEYDREADENYTQQNSDYAFMGRTLIDVREYYTEYYDEVENPEKFYPDRVYFAGYNEEGELVQTNYVHMRWAELFEESGNEKTEEYFYKIVGTTKFGPAHNEYGTADANETVEEDQFPHPAYPREYEDFPTA